MHGVLRQLLGHAGAGGVRLGSLACAADAAALQPQAMPDVLIATPSQLLALLRRGAGAGAAGKAKAKSGGGGGGGGGGGVQLRDSLHTMVIDEADLLLSYGYGDDIAAFASPKPKPKPKPKPNPNPSPHPHPDQATTSPPSARRCRPRCRQCSSPPPSRPTSTRSRAQP